jgi:hypothetical protein
MYNNLFTFSLYISNGTENVKLFFPDKPLQTVGASEGGAEGEGRTGRVKVKDGGRGRGDGGDGGGGEKVCGGVGD